MYCTPLCTNTADSILYCATSCTYSSYMFSTGRSPRNTSQAPGDANEASCSFSPPDTAVMFWLFQNKGPFCLRLLNNPQGSCVFLDFRMLRHKTSPRFFLPVSCCSLKRSQFTMLYPHFYLVQMQQCSKIKVRLQSMTKDTRKNRFHGSINEVGQMKAKI